MVLSQHTEQHFTVSDSARDMVIGMTGPFAPAAGLTGVISTTSFIVNAGSITWGWATTWRPAARWNITPASAAERIGV